MDLANYYVVMNFTNAMTTVWLFKDQFDKISAEGIHCTYENRRSF